MRGLITGREVIRHGPTIVRHFGPRCYLRCMLALFSRKPTTFLEVAFNRDAGERPAPQCRN
ncbi:MAG: hypothetical protein JST54_35905 [Deltaproteobacteria bacterium]|nr:hypothetical protein [Deltaproteobacteria bacterium]